MTMAVLASVGIYALVAATTEASTSATEKYGIQWLGVSPGTPTMPPIPPATSPFTVNAL